MKRRLPAVFDEECFLRAPTIHQSIYQKEIEIQRMLNTQLPEEVAIIVLMYANRGLYPPLFSPGWWNYRVIPSTMRVIQRAPFRKAKK